MKTKTKLVALASLSLAAAGSLLASSEAAADDIQAQEIQAQEIQLSDDETPFSLSVSNGSAKVGEPGTISVTVSAAEGFHANESYPHKIKDLAGDGLKLPGDPVMGTRTEHTITFSVPVTASSSGAHAVQGLVRFSVCNDSSCYIKKVPLSATFTGT